VPVPAPYKGTDSKHEVEAEMRISGDEQVHGPLLPSGDDVPDRPERLDLVASGLGCVLRCQVGREVVERLAVQGELEHVMTTNKPDRFEQRVKPRTPGPVRSLVSVRPQRCQSQVEHYVVSWL
jgi:hypothetical protein